MDIVLYHKLQTIRSIEALRVTIEATLLICCLVVAYPSGLSAKETTKEIVGELLIVQTQSEAENALKALFTKSGVGTIVTKTRFSNFVLSDVQIAELAKLHIEYLQNGKGYTIGKLCSAAVVAFDQINSEAVFFPLQPSNLDHTFTLLQEQVNLALREPEKPDNAFLIAIIAEGASIPNSAPRFNIDTALGPVQAFLFNLWFFQESIVYSDPNKKTQGIDLCAAKCGVDAGLVFLGCVFLPPPADIVCSALDGVSTGLCLEQCLMAHKTISGLVHGE